MLLICLNRLVSLTPAARLVESERGESLSPKIAPEMTAPAVIGAGTPRPRLMPIKATPKVAPVVQLLPVARDATAQIRAAVTKNIDGDISCNP